MLIEKAIPVSNDEVILLTSTKHSLGTKVRVDMFYIPDATNVDYIFMEEEHVKELIKALQEAIK